MDNLINRVLKGEDAQDVVRQLDERSNPASEILTLLSRAAELLGQYTKTVDRAAGTRAGLVKLVREIKGIHLELKAVIGG